MAIEATSQQNITLDGKTAVAQERSFVGGRKCIFNKTFDNVAAAVSVALQFGPTANLHYLLIANTGTKAQAGIKVDNVGTGFALGAGESLVLDGASVAKAVVDELSGGTGTFNSLDFTTTTASGTFTLEVVAVGDQ